MGQTETDSGNGKATGKPTARYEAVVMGVSYGGLKALENILPIISSDFPAPIMVVQHQDPLADDFLAKHLNRLSQVQVKVAEEKEKAVAGVVYLAPANYHLLVEDNHTLSLSIDEKVNFARPAIDVLFERGADAWQARLIGIILTGANHDGSQGLQRIKKLGGLAIVQDPQTAQAQAMPESALAATEVDYVLQLGEIGYFLNDIID